MRLIVLASGSSGNAALIESGGRALLLDAGISARETLRRIAASGASDARIEAVLLTHEHSDHVRGARVLARKLGIPVIGTPGTLRAAAGALLDVELLEPIEPGSACTLAGMRVRAFPTRHDAAEPCGYSFQDTRGMRIGIATDTGVVTAPVAEALAGSHVLGLESNHDLRMLAQGPYPRFLKERIAGERGHLSNDAAAEALAALDWSGLAHVFGLHLSEQNNTHQHAALALGARLRDGVTLETVSRTGCGGCQV